MSFSVWSLRPETFFGYLLTFIPTDIIPNPVRSARGRAREASQGGTDVAPAVVASAKKNAATRGGAGGRNPPRHWGGGPGKASPTLSDGAAGPQRPPPGGFPA